MASTPSKGQRFDVFPVLLGLLTLALLIPAAALYVNSGMSPWGEAHASPPSSEGIDPSDQNHGKHETKDDRAIGMPPDHSNGRGRTNSTTTSSAATTSSTTTTTLATTTSESITTTSTDSSNSGATDGVITGEACPCTVTGTVQLQGQIDLRGDLMVHGGTLIARPGVDLNGNGFQIMFMDGGKADFQGSEVFTWSNDGTNANLQRDIVIRNVSRIMFMEGAGKSIIRYVRISDAGLLEQLGFYPLHWHLNGNTTRGTLVEGVVIEGSKNHAFVPHGSHGITFKDTIAKNIIREAYWWDSGSAPNISHDIVYDHVLADGVDYPRALGDLGLHHRISAFYLGRGTGNVVRNSVARDVTGGADCSGFHWPETDHGVWLFENNRSYGSDCHGIFIWQNDSLPHVITRFSGGHVDYGAYLNQYRFEDLNVASVEVHALGRDGVSPVYDGGSVGAVIIRKHRLEGAPVIFRNLTLSSLTIDNAADSGTVPGTYSFENTNLTCSQVIYRSVVPGTRVIINGTPCS